MRKEIAQKIEDRLLATHISNNKEFETACLTGDARRCRKNYVHSKLRNGT